ESALPDDKIQEALERAEDEKVHDDWEDNPENPQNWTSRRKWLAVSVVSFYTLVGPLSSSMMAPGLPVVAVQYGITNPTIIALTLSIFLISFAIGPLVWAPLSEMYGRTWPLHISSIASVGFNLGCAFAPNTAVLIVMRFFVGLTSAAPIAIGAGSVSDVFSADQRASAMAIYALGPLLGPAIGPVAGGFAIQNLGLKYVFIILAGMNAWGGLCSVLGILLLRETYAPVLRMRRAKKDGELDQFLASHPEFASAHQSKLKVLWDNLSRPTVLLCRSLVLFMLSLYMAFIYGIYYLMFSTFGQLFSTVYGFKTGVGGLVYLGLGVGFLTSTAVSAKWADRIYIAMRERNGGVSKPEHRLPLLFPGAIFIPVGLLWYGWSADAQIHWIMPIIGTGIFSFAQMMTYLPMQLYIVDSYTFAASASSSAAVFRSLLGFAFPLFATQMFDKLGLGPGNSLLAGIAVLLGIPFPLWLYFKGEEMRKKDKYTR
ncbi:multidrug resistance protein 4, partial [Flagelloscypha sp. PMI_526]